VAARPEAAVLSPAAFSDLPGWAADDLREAWPAFRASCTALTSREPWREVCAAAAALPAPDAASVRRYFEAHFVPYQVANADGTTQGLFTGYYEPVLRGSRERRPPFVHPLHAPPEDLVAVDLAAVVPETRHLRLRGRIEGRRIVPYYSRAEIAAGGGPLAGREIAFVDDPVEAFFLHVQGSGRVRLPDGQELRLGYADQNGHPYRSIGRYLLDRGELSLAEATLQGIQAWARAHPERLAEVLGQNPSYVFFRELPSREGGPPGTLGVPLTAERSIAVDPRFVPLGAPVFVSLSHPATGAALERLVMAQDTGGAIRGRVRADFYWGTGPGAGALAGQTRGPGRMWVLWPRGQPP
jgi:membrane-bound lytic murein transglycosylase A